MSNFFVWVFWTLVCLVGVRVAVYDPSGAMRVAGATLLVFCVGIALVLVFGRRAK